MLRLLHSRAPFAASSKTCFCDCGNSPTFQIFFLFPKQSTTQIHSTVALAKVCKTFSLTHHRIDLRPRRCTQHDLQHKVFNSIHKTISQFFPERQLGLLLLLSRAKLLAKLAGTQELQMHSPVATPFLPNKNYFQICTGNTHCLRFRGQIK